MYRTPTQTVGFDDETIRLACATRISNFNSDHHCGAIRAVRMYLEDRVSNGTLNVDTFTEDELLDAIEEILADHTHRGGVIGRNAAGLAKEFRSSVERDRITSLLRTSDSYWEQSILDSAHNLKNHIGNIRRYAALAGEDFGAGKEKLGLRHIEKIQENAELLHDKLESKKQHIQHDNQPSRFRLSEFVSEVRKSAAGVGFDLQCALSKDATIVLSRGRLLSILDTLIHNANRYGIYKAGRTKKIFLELLFDKDAIVVLVSNNGGAMSVLQAKMVGRSSVAKCNRTETGWGVGLSLAQAFVEGWGGTFEIQPSSQYGGPLFSISIPGVSRVWIAEVSRRILVIDDSQNDREMIAEVLERCAYSDGCPLDVDFAETYDEALERCAAGQYGTALLDFDLTDSCRRTGIDLLRELRDKHPTLRLVLISGRMNDQLQREAEEAGATAAFDKLAYTQTEISALFAQ